MYNMSASQLYVSLEYTIFVQIVYLLCILYTLYRIQKSTSLDLNPIYTFIKLYQLKGEYRNSTDKKLNPFSFN